METGTLSKAVFNRKLETESQRYKNRERERERVGDRSRQRYTERKEIELINQY